MNPHPFRRELQIVSTVIGRIVIETGIGQGQNDQLHPDSLFSPLHCKHEKQVYAYRPPWFIAEP